MLKKKYKKRALAALMIAILLLAFTGTVAVSTQVVQAEQTEAETEAETARDIINPDDMTGVSKITGNIRFFVCYYRRFILAFKNFDW